jgi:hypothetical protein
MQVSLSSKAPDVLLNPGPPLIGGKLYQNINECTSLQFPWKLHEMLNDAEIEGFTSIVSWLPDYNSFKVHDQKAFTSQIMARYFRQTRYKSFQRQLNIWCFQRIAKGAGRGGYMHALFVRTKPSLCYSMKRTKNKGTTDFRQVGGEDEIPQSSQQETMTDANLSSKVLVHSHGETNPLEASGSCRSSSSSGSKSQTTDDAILYKGHQQQGDLGWLLEDNTGRDHEIFDMEDFDISSVEPQDLKYIMIGLELGRKRVDFSLVDTIPDADPSSIV